MRNHVLICFIFSVCVGSEAIAATFRAERFDFNDFPLSSGFSSTFDSLPVDGTGLNFEILRGDLGIDTAFIGEFGQVAISPFRFERVDDQIIVNFSRPVQSFSVRVGDFGADTPDRLRIRAYSDTDGSGDLLETDRGRLDSLTPISREFNDVTLSVSVDPGFFGNGFRSVVIEGGTDAFPNSVYYDDFVVGFEEEAQSALFVSKSAQSAYATLEFGAASAEVAAIAAPLAGACTVTTGPGAAACTVAGVAVVGVGAYAAYTVNDIKNIVDDPPDPNFETLVEIQRYSLSSPQPLDVFDNATAAALQLGLDALAERRGLLEAWLITLERAGGAELAGDMEARQRQLDYLDGIMAQMAVNTGQVDQFFDLNESLVAQYFGNPTLTAAQIAESKEVLLRDGLPSEVRAALQSLGYDDEVEALILGEISNLSPSERNLLDSFETIESLERQITSAVYAGPAGSLIDTRVLSTPDGPFQFAVEVEFLSETGVVDLFLGGQKVAEFSAFDFVLGEITPISLFIDDSSLFNVFEAPMSALLRGPEGSAAILGRSRIGEFAIPEVAAVPTPLGSTLLLSSLILLGCSRRSMRKVSG